MEKIPATVAAQVLFASTFRLAIHVGHGDRNSDKNNGRWNHGVNGNFDAGVGLGSADGGDNGQGGSMKSLAPPRLTRHEARFGLAGDSRGGVLGGSRFVRAPPWRICFSAPEVPMWNPETPGCGTWVVRAHTSVD